MRENYVDEIVPMMDALKPMSGLMLARAIDQTDLEEQIKIQSYGKGFNCR